MFEHRIVIGDWSDDGHGKTEYFTFKCSHDEEAIKNLKLHCIIMQKV